MPGLRRWARAPRVRRPSRRPPAPSGPASGATAGSSSGLTGIGWRCEGVLVRYRGHLPGDRPHRPRPPGGLAQRHDGREPDGLGPLAADRRPCAPDRAEDDADQREREPRAGQRDQRRTASGSGPGRRRRGRRRRRRRPDALGVPSGVHPLRAARRAARRCRSGAGRRGRCRPNQPSNGPPSIFSVTSPVQRTFGSAWLPTTVNSTPLREGPGELVGVRAGPLGPVDGAGPGLEGLGAEGPGQVDLDPALGRSGPGGNAGRGAGGPVHGVGRRDRDDLVGRGRRPRPPRSDRRRGRAPRCPRPCSRRSWSRRPGSRPPPSRGRGQRGAERRGCLLLRSSPGPTCPSLPTPCYLPAAPASVGGDGPVHWRTHEVRGPEGGSGPRDCYYPGSGNPPAPAGARDDRH